MKRIKPRRPQDERAKPPPIPCYFCGQPTTRNTKLIQGAVILRCDACRKMGTAAADRSEWVSFDDVHAIATLARMVEQDRQWAAMIARTLGDDTDDFGMEGQDSGGMF